MLFRMVRVLTALALILNYLETAAFAGGNEYTQGVTEYSAHHYNVALQYFGAAVRSNPRDYNSYYYMGLCYQAMHQMTLARQSFDWVTRSCPNPSLRANAAMASSQVAKYASGSGGSGPAPVQIASTAAVTSAAPAGEKLHGRLQVIEFYTDWCGYCKIFAPIWEQVAASQLRSKVDFKRLDGDDAANKALMDKWGVTGFPRLIFTDNTGKAYVNHRGAPSSVDDFSRMITEFLAQHS